MVDTVPAFQYEIRVYEGVEDFIHGGGHITKEIFIPSYNVIINSTGEIFASNEARNKEQVDIDKPSVVKPLSAVNLPKDLVEKVVVIARLKLEATNKQNEVRDDIKKLWG